MTHLSRWYPEGLTNLGVELSHITEALDAACGAAVSELSVEDEARPHAAGWRRQTLRGGTFSQPDNTSVQAVHTWHIETCADGLRFLVLH